ncbi:MAG: hypothetical protein JWM11_4482, partial [Planctomycetaceae bacterium]|nr:hypothetical protein [Planctomycetaceae bacterium]
ELERSVIEPNPFYSHWMVLPALRQFDKDQGLRVAFVYRNVHGRNIKRVLCGVFPFSRQPGFRDALIPILQLWRHPQCFLCTPLVRIGHAKDVIRTVINWARNADHGYSLLEFPRIHGEGPFQKALIDILRQENRLSCITEQYTRAMLVPGTSAENYLASAMSNHNRKEMRRRQRQLEACGRLELRKLGKFNDLDIWVDQFLDLECSGWKGREKTALGCSEADKTFFKDVCRSALFRGRLMLIGLYLDGAPIAMKCNFISDHGSFAYKITYDERLAKYSPGTQLEIMNIKLFHEELALGWMDSCAGSDHFMLNRILSERRTIQSLLISTGSPVGDLLVSARPLAKFLKRVARRFIGAV